MFSRIKIVTLVRVQLALLSLLLLGVLSAALWQTINERRDASYMQRVHEVASALDSTVADLVRQEISLNIAASLPRSERPHYLSQAEALQAEAEASYATAMAKASDHDWTEDRRFADLIQQAQAAMTAWKSKRGAAASLLNSRELIGTNERGPLLEPLATAANEVQTLTEVLENTLRSIDTVVGQQIAIRQNAVMLWFLAEREYTHVASALASSGGARSIDVQEIRKNEDQMLSLWARLQTLAKASPRYDHLRPALETTRSNFFDSYRVAVDDLLAGKRNYDLSEWVSIASSAMASIDGLEAAASDSMQYVMEERISSATTAFIIQVILLVVALASMAQVFLVMQARLVRPVGELIAYITELTRGNLDKQIELKSKQDEIGEIASALDSLRKESLRAREAEKQREIDRQRELQRAAEVEKLSAVFDGTISQALDHSLEISETVSRNATRLNEAAEQVTHQSEVMDQAAEQATHNVETVASASEELAASIREINQQIEQSRALSEEAVQRVRETSGKVSSLSASAERIDTVRKLITDIAEKTNLLALNAAIEAARAGEAGKGFNVVASEVKDLAKQTADATEEIDRQIRAMETDTKEVVSGTETIESFISKVNESIATIASAAEEQSAATQEISRSVQSAAAGNKQVSDGMGDVRQVAVSTNEMASEMLSRAADLNEHSRQLREKFSEFLEQIRRN